MTENSLLRSLFDDEERRPHTVSELNAQVKGEVERRFGSVWVEGEIVNFTAARSGHWYFTLHDGFSQIKAACFKGANWRIRFKPFDGLQVRIRGRITVYEPKGEYQLMVESLEPVGEGALKIAYEQIKAKLDGEGLFAEELKRPLPFLPRRIGVVTSPTGAAFFDILHVLSRRARSVSVLLIPTRVQGENAADEIRQAISLANEYNLGCGDDLKLDVLIVGRGGGSAEDLWAFNEEHLARAIRSSAIPVISAVGHEIDFTIADLVADVRAATPSAAAEIVAAREADVESFIDDRTQTMLQLMNYQMLKATGDLHLLSMAPVFAEFPGRVRELRHTVELLDNDLMDLAAQAVDERKEKLDAIVSQLSPLKLASNVSANVTRLALLAERQNSASRSLFESKLKSLKICMAKLDALSPLAVLDRGFSLVETEAGGIVRSTAQVKSGDRISVRVSDGKFSAEVLDKGQNENE